MKKIKFIFALAVLMCTANTGFAQDVHHGTLTEGGSLYFRADPVNKFFMEDENNQDLALYFHLEGVKKSLSVARRNPYNLSIVIDKSGSMSGEKMNNLKKAVNYIIDHLSAEDYLSVVCYDDNVSVLFEPQAVSSKENLIGKINSIVADGGTNLEGGMKKGFEMAKNNKISRKGSEFINRVFLLSDGQANVGEVRPDVLANWCKSYFTENSISMSTFGLGTDYNEDLMSKIASNSGGMYYFISHPEKITSIFEQEMSGISNAVAKNVVLEIDVTDENVALAKVYQFGYEQKGNKIVISFNDIFAEEQKSVLVKFKQVKKTSAFISFTARLVYRNCNQETITDVKDERKVVLDPVKTKDQLSIGLSKQGSEGYTLQVTNDLYEEAVKLADNGKYEESTKMITEALELMDVHFKRFGEHPFLKEAYKDMKEYKETIKEMKDMSYEQKSFRIKSFKHSKYHRSARSKF